MAIVGRALMPHVAGRDYRLGNGLGHACRKRIVHPPAGVLCNCCMLRGIYNRI